MRLLTSTCLKIARPWLVTGLMTGLVVATAALGGCSNDNAAAGISTASLLDGKSSAGSGELAGPKPDDVTAKSVQVAWTSARAQKCGFNFDAAKLKANYLAAEARDGAAQAQLAAFDKTYDATLANVTKNINAEDSYCTERKTAAIKTDLQRHLAGNYAPNLPTNKKVASESFWDSLKSDAAPEKFDAKNFWADQAARKDGAKGAQKTDE